jgi:hypothetical protein
MWATATTWCFNFILSFTWPNLVNSFKPQGAFGWYAAWCIIGWFLVLLLVPETKCKLHGLSAMNSANVLSSALTLEELDQVFSVSTRKHASYQVKYALRHLHVWIFRQKLEPLPEFYQSVERLAEVADKASKAGKVEERGA